MDWREKECEDFNRRKRVTNKILKEESSIMPYHCCLCCHGWPYEWKNTLIFNSSMRSHILKISYVSYVALMWQLLMNLSEKSTYFVHNFRSCGKAISSHGFALPLKWMTPASSTSAILVFSWYPNPSMCQKGSIMWTWLWNAINPGGKVPSCHKLRSDLIFCSKQNKKINTLII